MDNEPRNVLMTGGWDSSFRMLYLLLVEKRAVQPIYILDPERWSVVQELKAMAQIKRAVIDRFPETVPPLILPTIIYDKTDIKFDKELKDAEQAVCEQCHIGGQYVWLSGAVKQFNIKDAELCVENTTEKYKGCLPSVRHLLVEDEDGTKRVDSNKKETPQYTLYGKFSFPITTFFKPDMLKIAKQNGFLDIIELSWFCHRPNFLGQACGTCNPCQDAMKKGMAHRVPLFGRLCFYLKKGLNPRPLLKKTPGLYAALKQLKKKAQQ